MTICHQCNEPISADPFERRYGVNVPGLGMRPHHERCTPEDLLDCWAALGAACDTVDNPENV